MNDTEILTANEAADLLKVSPATITRLCQRGQLSHVRVGKQLRFRRQWLDEYLDSNRVSSEPLQVQSVIGPALRFPALRGGRNRVPNGNSATG